MREVTIPANTRLTITLVTPIASDNNKVEDPVIGRLAEPLVIDGTTVVPAGAELNGSVLAAVRSGRVKGRASIAFAFDRMTVAGASQRIQTTRISRVAQTNRKKDVTTGGIGAGVGAVIGGIAGGGKGAAIGAAAGGTGAVLATRGEEVRLPAGTDVSTTLRAPIKVVVPNE
jgi:hypothetical protein